ncbi:MAG: poly-beta-1,6-N-acetyl-D-glucosamine N-deacetylase PgaB [Thermodesulfobacteriota bacterium]
MMKRLTLILLFCVTLHLPCQTSAAEMKRGEFLVISYHSVLLHPSPNDPLSISQLLFTEQMEYLKTHGYHPVSLGDIISAGEGKTQLPERALLLTFDDGYRSYYNFVAPLLKEYGYPSLVAIIGNFVDNPPDNLTEPLMSWEQIREVNGSPLVEVISHTYGLHNSIQYTPQGNVGAAARVRAYHKETNSYESEEEFRGRLDADFKAQAKLFRKRLAVKPRAVVWPYGRFTRIGDEAARKAGYAASFSLEDGYGNSGNLFALSRHLVYNEPIGDFIALLHGGYDAPPIRAVQVDLDAIYVDGSPKQTGKNLDRLIDRLVAMKVNTVFLQAFADPDRTGVIKSVYFPNSVLPVRADIFSHIVHQIVIRDMEVFPWMPILNIELPDSERNRPLRADDEAKRLVRTLYEELAAHAQIDGVLFQDDDCLSREREREGAKTEAIIDFTRSIMDGVRSYNHEARFARNICSTAQIETESRASFAQEYKLFLQAYDLVVVTPSPQMAGVGDRASPWLTGLVDGAKEVSGGIEKSLFKVASYDWKGEKWRDEALLLEEIRNLLAAGARNIAYYPDNPALERPGIETMGLEMSTENYPFMP